MDALRVILIGGSSHSGKSTLAEALAVKLGWSHRSTDLLARHPGRPWPANGKAVPPHVAEHYAKLSVDELIEDVMRHYRENVWPQVETIVAEHASGVSAPLILEGSALWPEWVATLNCQNAAAIWLTGSDKLFQLRIYGTSQFEAVTGGEKRLIEKFLARTQRYNQRMMQEVNRLGLQSLDVETASLPDELAGICLARLRPQTDR